MLGDAVEAEFCLKRPEYSKALPGYSGGAFSYVGSQKVRLPTNIK
jgi:hypothetical protein